MQNTTLDRYLPFPGINVIFFAKTVPGISILNLFLTKEKVDCINMTDTFPLITKTVKGDNIARATILPGISAAAMILQPMPEASFDIMEHRKFETTKKKYNY